MKLENAYLWAAFWQGIFARLAAFFKRRATAFEQRATRANTEILSRNIAARN
jgi:hypothetical protein